MSTKLFQQEALYSVEFLGTCCLALDPLSSSLGSPRAALPCPSDAAAGGFQSGRSLLHSLGGLLGLLNSLCLLPHLPGLEVLLTGVHLLALPFIRGEIMSVSCPGGLVFLSCK
ncbi:unnamed protein product [Rangifer tarandus platyrhynchus]|uniref:Uncharacterized protein n=2 Tax=Rangifer tarandus platyrhynchus TaxID=3082113 RepID=A0AC59YMT6_RANTA|nr:unnamed protein product [Rangifer tarandus platyrhynchus]